MHMIYSSSHRLPTSHSRSHNRQWVANAQAVCRPVARVHCTLRGNLRQQHAALAPQVSDSIPTEVTTSAAAAGCGTVSAAPLEYSNPELDTSSLLKRQVFISHTGQDKDACTFAASILKPMLEGAGLPVYMDFSNLQKGDEYPPQLLEAATCSEVVLVVLSRSFSRRFWCMVELEQALHGTSGRRPVILPVIYHPTEDVDSKAAVMQYWQEWKATELNQSRPDRWHKVVPEHWASNYTYVCDTIQGIRRQQQGPKDTDFQLAREAAKLALQHLSPAPPTEQLFGVAELQADLLKRLTSGKCQGLWLYGEGGIGKTALAKRLFHALASSGKFLSKASVEIKDSDVADSVAQTYQQLNSSGPSDGLSAAGLQAMMRGKKLLLLLDNVSCCEQLDALLPEAYTEGSIIIVTSRMKSCRGSNRQQVIDQLHHLRVEPLDPIPSRELFLEKAGLSTISDNLAGLGNDIIALCNGLPLALQLAGAAMSEHSGNPAIWSGVLAALKKGGLHVDTQQRLQDVVQRRLSAMPHGQQSMFLDVATALSGQPADVVLDVWKDWHGAEAAMWYADLVRNCLLRPSSDDRLQMHDVLAAMGRGMVLDQQSPFYGSRIWVQDNIIVGAVQGCRPVLVQLDPSAGLALSWGKRQWLPALPSTLKQADLSEVRILLLRNQPWPTSRRPTVPMAHLLWLDVSPEPRSAPAKTPSQLLGAAMAFCAALSPRMPGACVAAPVSEGCEQSGDCAGTIDINQSESYIASLPGTDDAVSLGGGVHSETDNTTT